MMNIKDLSTSKELDRKAMAEVRGGLNIDSATVGTADQKVDNDGFGLALGVQEQNVTSVINAAEVRNRYSLPYRHFDGYKGDYKVW
jgi:hypothetical protein